MNIYHLKIKRQREGDRRLYPSADGSDVPDNGHIFRKLSGFDEIPPPAEIPLLDYFTLTSFEVKTRWEWILCDAMNFQGKYPMSCEMFVSEKFKKLLESFNLGNHAFYESRLMFKGEKLTYFIFKQDEDVLVDFSKSKFRLEKGMLRPTPLEDFEGIINSKKELREIEKQLEDKYLKFKKMAFLAPQTDMFLIRELPKLGISERLKNEIENAGITGIEISPFENIEFEFLSADFFT